METDLYGMLAREDHQLALGSKVTAFWARGGFYYHGPAEVVRLNQRSVSVILLQTVGQMGEFPPGREMVIPRISDPVEWSSSNCVRLANSNFVPPWLDSPGFGHARI